MAKRNNSVSFQKGLFNLATMEITEEDKNGLHTYDLLEELRKFDGKYISLIIKEEFPIVPKKVEE